MVMTYRSGNADSGLQHNGVEVITFDENGFSGGAIMPTDAEAQGLTNTKKIITPEKLAKAFQGANQSLAANGYQKLPGGLIVQWGGVVASTGGGTPVTFPIAFPNAIFSCVGTLDNQLTNYQLGSQTVNGFNAIAAAGTPFMRWLAIGY